MRESLQIPRVHKLEKNGDEGGKKSGGKLPAHDRSRENLLAMARVRKTN